MYLANNEILKAIENKVLTVLLGNRFKVFNSEASEASDPTKKISPVERSFTVPDGERIMLNPRDYLLAETADYVGSRELLIHISGKSSLARVGLMIHNTAGIVNPGHYLQIVLEISNQSNVPIILRPKMPIAQLLFTELSSKPSKSYESEFARDNWKVSNCII